jgi:hypothetical protein
MRRAADAARRCASRFIPPVNERVFADFLHKISCAPGGEEPIRGVRAAFWRNEPDTETLGVS